MAISVTQRACLGNAAAGSTIAQAFSGNLTAGNAVIAIGTTDGAATTLVGVTGSQGKFYNLVSTISGTSFKFKVWIAYNMNAAAETVTLTTGFNDSNLFIFEVSGLAPNFAFDKSQFSNQSSATSLTSGNSYDLLHPNNLLIGITANTPNPGVAPTVGAGYSNLQTLTTNFNGGGSEEQIVASKNSVSATFGLAANVGNETTAVFVFSDVQNSPLVLNNYKFVSASDGISVTEKIR